MLPAVFQCVSQCTQICIHSYDHMNVVVYHSEQHRSHQQPLQPLCVYNIQDYNKLWQALVSPYLDDINGVCLVHGMKYFYHVHISKHS